MRFLSVVAAAALATMSVPAAANTVTTYSAVAYAIEYYRPLEPGDDLIFSPINLYNLPNGGSISLPEIGWVSYSQTHEYQSSIGGGSSSLIYFHGSLGGVSGHYYDMSNSWSPVWAFNTPPVSFVLEQWTMTSFDCTFMDCFAMRPDAEFVTMSTSSDWGKVTRIGTVPEPSTWALLILGFAGIALIRRFRPSRAGTIPLPANSPVEFG